MKPIEIAVPASHEKIEAVLMEISTSGLFEVKRDTYREPTAQRLTFRVSTNAEEMKRPELVCMLELIRKKDQLTMVKISEPYQTGQSALPATGSPLTRFVSMFSQSLMTWPQMK